MLRFGTTSRVRRAAVAVISPMVTQSRVRLGGIPDIVWRRPYMIGFVTTLVTVLAKYETGGRIGTQQLGIAQVDTWAEITGQYDDRIGEEICLLSAQADEEFMQGCRNASRFLEAYWGVHHTEDADIRETCENASVEQPPVFGPGELRAFGRGGAVAALLWSRYFDEQIP